MQKLKAKQKKLNEGGGGGKKKLMTKVVNKVK